MAEKMVNAAVKPSPKGGGFKSGANEPLTTPNERDGKVSKGEAKGSIMGK